MSGELTIERSTSYEDRMDYRYSACCMLCLYTPAGDPCVNQARRNAEGTEVACLGKTGKPQIKLNVIIHDNVTAADCCGFSFVQFSSSSCRANCTLFQRILCSWSGQSVKRNMSMIKSKKPDCSKEEKENEDNKADHRKVFS